MAKWIIIEFLNSHKGEFYSTKDLCIIFNDVSEQSIKQSMSKLTKGTNIVCKLIVQEKINRSIPVYGVELEEQQNGYAKR